MRTTSLVLTLAVPLAVALPGCGRGGTGGPGRDALLAQLSQEAAALKAENEGQDTSLGVKATWNVQSVDVVEPPKGTDKPWTGTIRFRIHSETRDGDGKVLVDEFERTFNYVYNTTIQKWVFEYKPS